ncbi:MAG: type II toxin-antitoxin system HicB family antitoxin [Spirochaetales bacterium]|nr:type II toxin-antitoxin system HicB family antitoxin [Spirochaetales bacterium]
MEKISYLAVFERSDDGYSIYFPDIPGCCSWGENITDAQAMAREALELHLYGMEQDGEEFPNPSENVKGITADDIVVLITAYPELFRDRYESRKVRMNVTISSHLKNLAQQENINCSQVLELALRNMLGIQQRV